MKQGTIWRVNLDPAVGAEIKKNRPCVIVNSNRIGKLPLKIVAPLTDCKKHYKNVPWMVIVRPTKENGLLKTSVIDLFQVRSVSQKRLVKKLGIIDSNTMDACKEALNIVFE
jgi:mRNA interferase MazF